LRRQRRVEESPESRIFRRIRLSRVVPNDMTIDMKKDRPIVSRDRDVMGGGTVFHGTRAPAQPLPDNLKSGETIDDILEGSPPVADQYAIASRAEAGDRAQQQGLYHPDDDEWAAIEEGFAQAKRSESISANQIVALFRHRDT
jgi:uncharacterized protein (DUF433 family)